MAVMCYLHFFPPPYHDQGCSIFLTRQIPFPFSGLRVCPAIALLVHIFWFSLFEYGALFLFTFRLGTICILPHAGGTSSSQFKWCTEPTTYSYWWATHWPLYAGAWDEVKKRFGIWKCVTYLLLFNQTSSHVHWTVRTTKPSILVVGMCWSRTRYHSFSPHVTVVHLVWNH